MSRTSRSGPRAALAAAVAAADQSAGVIDVALAMHVACATIDVRAVQTSIADAITDPADLYFLIATSSNDEGRPLVGLRWSLSTQGCRSFELLHRKRIELVEERHATLETRLIIGMGRGDSSEHAFDPARIVALEHAIPE